MIGWQDAYKVVEAMAPLYAALALGYGSVKWWRVFTPDQAEAINRLVCYFTLPLFAFEFTAHVDPFKMNYKCMLADAISKVIIVLVLALWAKCSGKGSYCWSITGFSLSTLTNSLVVGVPLLKAMYGQMAVDLVVQFSVVQALVWLTVVLFALEVRRTTNEYLFGDDGGDNHSNDGKISDGNSENCSGVSKNDLENHENNCTKITITNMEVIPQRPSIWTLTNVVGFKLAMNPNSYACVIGIIWALLSNRLHFEMPSIMEGSILIISRAGTGTAMFSMGIFMAMQEKVIACGASMTVIGMALKFIAGPLAMAIASLAVGLHGDVLRVVIIQAALPQSITSFIFAKEYGLHADVLSTAVIFGMIVSLPVLVGYYAALEFVR